MRPRWSLVTAEAADAPFSLLRTCPKTKTAAKPFYGEGDLQPLSSYFREGCRPRVLRKSRPVSFRSGKTENLSQNGTESVLGLRLKNIEGIKGKSVLNVRQFL